MNMVTNVITFKLAMQNHCVIQFNSLYLYSRILHNVRWLCLSLMMYLPAVGMAEPTSHALVLTHARATALDWLHGLAFLSKTWNSSSFTRLVGSSIFSLQLLYLPLQNKVDFQLIVFTYVTLDC